MHEDPEARLVYAAEVFRACDLVPGLRAVVYAHIEAGWGWEVIVAESWRWMAEQLRKHAEEEARNGRVE